MKFPYEAGKYCEMPIKLGGGDGGDGRMGMGNEVGLGNMGICGRGRMGMFTSPQYVQTKEGLMIRL